MNNIDFKSSILPHLIAFGFFLMLTVFFFKPVVINNKTLKQHDVIQSKGGAKEVRDYREETGKEALWTNSMFGGMPAYLIDTSYPGNVFEKFRNVIFFGLPHPANLFIWLMIGFYILLLAYRVNPYVALIGAMAYALATYNILIIEAGHNTKVASIAFVPIVLSGIKLIFDRKYFLGFGTALFSAVFLIQFSHYQIVYYGAFIILFMVGNMLFFAIKKKEYKHIIKSGLVLLLAGVLSVVPNFGKIMTVLEYNEYSIRGGSELSNSLTDNSGGLDNDYAFNWSYGIGETFTLFIPDFMGGASTSALDKDSEMYKVLTEDIGVPKQDAIGYIKQMPLYWGDQPFTGGPFYIGAIIFFLFILGLFVLNKKQKAWLFSVTILSFFLAWGHNFSSFNNFMFDYFPAYNKFRVVSTALVIAQVSMLLMGILALKKFLSETYDSVIQKKFFRAVGVSAGLALFFVLFSGMFFDFSSAKDASIQFPQQYKGMFLDALETDRQSALRSDALRSMIFVLLAAVVMFFYKKDKINMNICVALLGLLIFVDLLAVSKRYLTEDDFEKKEKSVAIIPKTPVDEEILKDTTYYRVLNIANPFNDATTSYYHHSAGGYHGAKIRRYQDFGDSLLMRERSIISNFLSKKDNVSNIGQLMRHMDGVNMMNIKYLVLTQPPYLIKNRQAFGSAWFVNKVKKVSSPDEEIKYMANKSIFDPQNEAVVDTSIFNELQDSYEGKGNVSLKKYEPNNLIYEVEIDNKGLMVFSEVYYPKGWKAFIDGKETKILRVNYILRAIEVPRGAHKVKLVFDPETYKYGNSIALIGSVLVLLLGGASFAVVFFQEVRKTTNN